MCSVAAPQAEYNSSAGQVSLSNGRLQLLVETRAGLNPRSLVDTVSGRVYADADYAWPGSMLPALVGEPIVTTESDGSCTVVFTATLDSIEIRQTFAAPAGETGLITEEIRLCNPGASVLDTSSFVCGFSKKIYSGANWLADVADAHFCDVPYRAHPETGEVCDYTVPELATKQSWFSTVRSPHYSRQNSATWGAEGWAWYKGGNALLISKYNADSMEWSLVEPVQKGAAKNLRYGGAGRWKLGDPEGAASLPAGVSFTFGVTRYQALDGGWKEAYAAYRKFSETKGHVVPADYDMPVHWNELYDNQLWWVGDTPPNRDIHYRRADMEVEAEKAKDLGCQCLYLDPGWDTSFGSNIWADARLGTQTSFVEWLKSTYGFALALHTPLAPWSDAESYPVTARMMTGSGERTGDLCAASPGYADTKIARLTELYKRGAYFFMYDGSWFPGECWDPTHGHPVPLTRQAHIDAILRLSQRLHAACPNAVIEQHDPMIGPGTPRYVPTYFMHGKPGAFDELWGYEYMIDPMDDILSHRAYSLYYLNLAYSIPVYLHIDLRKDNAQAMMLWWYASTCRHLGVGGKSSDPAVWAAQKTAMAAYLRNKRFFAQGVFHGLDETIHAHTLPDVNQCVINCFNITDSAVQRMVQFKLSDIGLPSSAILVDGALCSVSGDQITLTVPIAAMGHRLVEIRMAGDPAVGTLP
jgi:hypothetical protein